MGGVRKLAIGEKSLETLMEIVVLHFIKAIKKKGLITFFL